MGASRNSYQCSDVEIKEVDHDASTTFNAPSMLDTPMEESENTEYKTATSEKPVAPSSTKQQNFGYSFDEEPEGNYRHGVLIMAYFHCWT